MTHERTDGYSMLLAELDAETAASAMAVAVAVYSAVTIADRFRAAIGVAVAVQTEDQAPDAPPIAGVVKVVCSDGVLIGGQGAARDWLVLLASVASVTGLPQAHRPAASPVAQRRSAASLLRQWIGSRVAIGLRGRQREGLLERVGADHVQLRSHDGSAVVPFAAICWVRGYRHGESAGSGFARM